MNIYKELFCHAYYFNFFSSRNSFLSIHKNIVRLLVWHIISEKRKTLKKELNEELMTIA